MIAAVLALIVGVAGWLAIWIGVGGTVVVFAILAAVSTGSVPRHQATMATLFPDPERDSGA